MVLAHGCLVSNIHIVMGNGLLIELSSCTKFRR